MFGRLNRQVTKIFIALVAFLMLTYAENALAGLQDSDVDGVTDEAEVTRYYTDPKKANTDGDTLIDSDEILQKSNPLDPQSTPEQVKMITERTSSGSSEKSLLESNGTLAIVVFVVLLVGALAALFLIG